MKTKPKQNSSTIARKITLSQSLSKCLLGSLAVATVLPSVVATCRADDAPSRSDALLGFQFSDKYLTPRGMIVTDSGLTTQILALGFLNVYKGDSDSFINSITLVPGVWNDFSTKSVAGNVPGSTSNWIEIDPIAGISVGLGKNFKLDETYTDFNMQINQIPFSQHLDSKLSYNDTDYLKDFALHPYFEYWQELEGKATAADVPYIVDPLNKHLGSGPGSSYYFEVGVDPGYTFSSSGLQIEFPCRVLLPSKDFYGTYYTSASTVGLYEVGVKATIPLKFMPQGYGHWSADVGFKYMKFEDGNLQAMQVFNAPGKSVQDTCEIYAGLTTFF